MSKNLKLRKVSDGVWTDGHEYFYFIAANEDGKLTVKNIMITDLISNRMVATNASKVLVSSIMTDAQALSLVDDSMVDALHRHSELSASDGTPNAAIKLDAFGDMNIVCHNNQVVCHNDTMVWS